MTSIHNTVQRLLEHGLSTHLFSGAQAAWVHLDTSPNPHTLSVGSTCYEEHTPHQHTRSTVDASTLFDTASLTKALVTAPLVWVAVEKGWMSLEDPLDLWLPTWSGAGSGVTVRHVLNHTSGLPAWVALYQTCLKLPPKDRPAALRDAALAVVPEVAPGSRALYSDVGYILLGFALERCFRAPLHEAAATWIFSPLGMHDTHFARPLDGVELPYTHVAATEATAADSAQGPALVGRVHDENASTLGGVAGHAGLFSTASDVLTFARALLAMDGVTPPKPSRLPWSPATLRAVCSPHAVQGFHTAQDTVGSFVGGLDTPSGPNSTAGPHATRTPQGSTLGHLGFTGTSFWVDRARRVVVVLLTNRVHPTRDNGPAMRAFRVRFHTEVFEAIDRASPQGALRSLSPYSPVLHAYDPGWVARRPRRTDELHTVIQAVKHAGAVARMRATSPNALGVHHKGTVDLVTEVDHACQEIIVRALQGAFPSHDILAEEDDTSLARLRSLRPVWIIDPIDGTTNFSHRLPHFAMSVALMVRGVIVLGVVYDPMRDELFCAQRGCGASLNGAPIETTRGPALAQALAATGFPYDRHTSPDNNAPQAGAMLRRVQGLRRAGAAALDLAWVACGRLDLYWEKKLAPWDIAAGLLLVEEAGGVVCSWSADAVSLHERDVIAAGSARLASEVSHVVGSDSFTPCGVKGA